MKEVFGPFFLVLSSVTNLKGLFLGVHKLFWQLLWNLLEPFLGPKKLLKTQIFEKKFNISSEKKIFDRFLSYYGLEQTSEISSQWSIGCFDNYCRVYRSVFLGPERLLKTQIFKKKGNLPREEKNLAFVFLYHWTRQKSGNNLQGSIWSSENCCAIDKIISLGPNRSIETIISKNSCFHDDERF